MAETRPDRSEAASAAPAWLTGGGEMGALVRSMDWSATALGPLSSWPTSLKTIVGVVLGSRFPMLIWWGPELCQLYNDGYRLILGEKHPASMGAPGREVWAEIWPVVGPMAEGVLGGAPATWNDDLQLMMNRKGFLEETYFTFSYSPVPADDGRIGGVLVTCAETTDRVYDDRRLRMLRDLATRVSDAKTAEEVCRTAAAVLAENPSDVAFALLYLADDPKGTPRLVASSGWSPLPADTARAGRLVAEDVAATQWSLAEAIRAARGFVVDDLRARSGDFPRGSCPSVPERAIVLPLSRVGQGLPYGFLVAGLSACRALDERYAMGFCLVAEQVARGIAKAEAFEEERKRAESLAEIDRAKTVFFSNVSHEFRTPLTLILGPVEEALRSPERALGGEDLRLAHRNTVRLLKLVNTLLDFSRIEAGRVDASYEPCDISALTADLASGFRSAIERAGVRLDVDCPPLAEPVFLDREMWEKVVLNLLSNAFKFTFDGTIRVALRLAGGQVELEVSDTGVGIPKDELPHLFERFHRSQGGRARTHEGSGIGLALVRELVGMHGGTIAVRSETGGAGTSFTVALPLGSSHLPAARLRTRGASGPLPMAGAPYLGELEQWLPAEGTTPAEPRDDIPRARILVVDDNRDMREYVTRLLQPHWMVEAVADGRAALEAARHNPPDLVLADVMMPRLDGLELVRELRADRRFGRTPIILLSARAGEESSRHGRSAGADDYLVKPFSARDLVARVAAQLERARVRAVEEAHRNRLFDLFVQAPVAIAVVRGPDHTYDFFNQAYQEVVAGRASVGKRVADALPEVEAQGIIPILDRVRETGEPFIATSYPILLDQKADGHLAETYFNLVFQSMPEDDTVLVTAFEVTDQVRARAEVEAGSRAKDEFLAMLSHELRNPLAPILTALGLLRLRGEKRNEKELVTIERQLRLLVRLVDDLLDVSRISKGVLHLETQPIEVAEVVATALETANPLFEKRAQRLTVAVAPRGLAVAADPNRLAQAITNLLINAAKYTEVGGQVSLSAAREAEEVVVRVVDNGIGIPADVLPTVFDPFVQGRQAVARSGGGLGLGLAIMRGLVQLHGGSVSVRSEGAHRGSEFTVRLPAAGPEPAAKARRPVAVSPTAPRVDVQRILVVDDNADAAETLAEFLRALGHETRIALDGPSAIRAAEEFVPTIALLDIGLPVMDGYELAQKLRERWSPDRLRLLAVTGYGQETDRERSRDAGFDLHLVKPVVPDRLRSIIEGFARRGSAAAP